MKKIILGLFMLGFLFVGIHTYTEASESAMCPSNGAPFITVVTPNGGETYRAGQQITVGWTSCNIPVVSNNKIDIILHGYNSNGVIVWSKELSNFTLNDGYEIVTLPTNLGGVPFGKNFVISVGTDSTNNPLPIFDYSDGTFTISATDIENPSISITSPNESNTINNTTEKGVLRFNIKAENSDVNINSFKIIFENKNKEISSSRLSNYITDINTYWEGTQIGILKVSDFEMINSGLYSKTLPIALGVSSISNNQSKDYYIKVKMNPSFSADDINNNWRVSVTSIRYTDSTGFVRISDASAESTFIVNSQNTTPSITVLSPNGGEKIDLNTPFTIKWDTKGLDPNSLLGISITAYKIMNDAVNNNESNSVGTTVLNSVRADAGQASVIFGSENLSIVPMINEGINFDNVKLKIFNWEPYNTISDTSDLPFSIVSNPALIPSITVLSPNGGETYKPYDQITVKWKSKNIDSNKMVNIYLSAPDQSDDIPLISNTPNDGVQSVVITPEQLMKKPGVTSFKILVVSSGLNDFSDNYFTIGSSTEDGCKNGQVYSSTTGAKCPVVNTTPSITVLSPNGGETFYLGDKINVKWKSNNLPSNAKVAVYLEEMPNSGYGTTRYGMNQEMLINDGEEVVALTPSGVLNKYGKYFKIAIVYYVDGTVVNVIEDTSDNYFTINAPSASLISQCLRDKGAVLYTASWCSYCQNQEKLFGDYFGNINQVECSNSARGEQSAVCNKENITGYPTWKFKDGSILNGTQSLSALAEKVGCNFSTKIDNGCSVGAIYSSTTGNPCNTSAGPNNVYTSYSGQSLGTGSSTSSTVITRTLKIGIKGDDVKALQAFLNLLADGSFGPKTQAKVMEWQSAHGLTADGSFGPMSRQKAGLAQ